MRLDGRIATLLPLGEMVRESTGNGIHFLLLDGSDHTLFGGHFSSPFFRDCSLFIR